MPEDHSFPSSNFSVTFNKLVDHCIEHEINYTLDEQKKFIRIPMTTCCGAIFRCQWHLTHEDTTWQIKVQFPLLIEKKMRETVCEFITRVNYPIVLGKFEMDMDDGEFNFHLGHYIADTLEDSTIRRVFGIALSTADKYFIALMRVLFGGHTPEDAIYLANLDGEESRKPKLRKRRRRNIDSSKGSKEDSSEKKAIKKKTTRLRRKKLKKEEAKDDLQEDFSDESDEAFRQFLIDMAATSNGSSAIISTSDSSEDASKNKREEIPSSEKKEIIDDRKIDPTSKDSSEAQE